MDLDLLNKQWKAFTFQEIFTIERGEQGVYKKDLQSGIYPYVSASASNNGITDRINRKNRPKNLISIAYDGSTGSAFFHDYEWFASEKVVSVDLKNWKLNKYIAGFLIQTITKQKEKFGYGYKWSVGIRMNRSKIVLPVDSQGNPDYAFMEAYMRQKEQEKLDKYKDFVKRRLPELQDYKSVGELDSREWREFYIQDVFTEMQRGKRLKKADHKIGKIPYISSTAVNNGVDGFVGNNHNVRMFQNCLTIANSGSVGATFYHSYSFIASDHVTKLENNKFNEHVYKFISVLINRMSTKYSFNREINDTRIKREKLMLPVNLMGKPDYEFMENYIKRLEYQKLSRYLSLK